MKFDPQKHHRRSIRLPNYDYSQSGIYFVTICTYQKQCLFGEIHDGKMSLNQIGKIVAEEWLNSSKIRQEIELDEWIIMPNHLHGIVIITDNGAYHAGAGVGVGVGVGVGAGAGAGAGVGASLAPLQGNGDGFGQRKPRSLSSFIAGFKSSVTKRIKEICQQPNPSVWQRNYYESILRDEGQLERIREYIVNNPLKWHEDSEKPENQSQELLIDFLF